MTKILVQFVLEDSYASSFPNFECKGVLQADRRDRKKRPSKKRSYGQES